ncbi:hypothetical protein B484DRAFT_16640 [Ochromonadaceae sp. CCMP2298]|nr:hypothetical protein B484DRAFT_16640 [Ochromonadaceae sp. CCMP2298]
MAAARTMLAFLSVSGNNQFGSVSARMCNIGFAVVTIWAGSHGYHRYTAIKNILKLPDPPLYFGRLSNAPVTVFTCVLFVLALIAQVSLRPSLPATLSTVPIHPPLPLTPHPPVTAFVYCLFWR